MRMLALVLTVVVALTAPALADEEPDVRPFRQASVAIGVQGHTSRIGGREESGFAGLVELALGGGRWQYFGEVAGGVASLIEWSTSGSGDHLHTDGTRVRGGVGARWLARQFQASGNDAIELYLQSVVGMQRYSFETGARLVRPELAVGFGLQGRMFRKPRFGFRIDFRAVFTPNQHESRLVSCRGQCMTETGSSTGFMLGVSYVW